MIKQLIKLANHLDKKGLRKEADYLDLVIINLKNRLLGKKASYNGNKVQYYKDSQNNIYAKDTSEEYMWNGDSWQSGSVPSGSSRLGAIEAMKSNNIPKL